MLTPTANLQALNAEEEALRLRSDRLKSLKVELENQRAFSFASQGAVDHFNGLVDQYNSSLSSFRQDQAAYQRRTKTFNDQVDAYNAYLEAHCQRRY